MKTIGLLGGTGWSSTIGYYRLLNQQVNQRLGGYHSAKILLKSIDYHNIMTHYSDSHEKVAKLLQEELEEFIKHRPDCVIICCNTLHKFYDMIKTNLKPSMPIFHAIELVAQHCIANSYKKVLLLATKFTMEDGFFAKTLEQENIEVAIPKLEQRNEMELIHDELMKDVVTEGSRSYFQNLILQHKNCDAVILGCTEYPLVLNQESSILPIIDPVRLQTAAAVEFALEGIENNI